MVAAAAPLEADRVNPRADGSARRF